MKDKFLRVKVRKLISNLEKDGLTFNKFKLSLNNLSKSNHAIEYYTQKNIKNNSSHLKLTKKIILPESPRIIISIAEKIQSSNSLAKLKSQAMLFDDQNSLNWLINSDACIAIVPFSLCSKYLKMDSRLSVVFPNQGVPLMWHFILSKSDSNYEILDGLIP